MLRLVMIGAALVGAADLLLLLPVGLEARYAAGAFSLTVRAGPVPVRLLPKKRARGRTADRRKKSLPRRMRGQAVPIAARCGLAALGRLRGKVRLTRLHLRFTAGGPDPARAVMAYARAGLAMEAIGRLCAGRVPDTELRAEADLDGGTALDADVAVSAMLGYILWAGACFCFAFFREYYRYQKRKDDAENGRANGA